MKNKLTTILALILLASVTVLLKHAFAAEPIGDPVLVPEPISTSLFLLGGATLGLKAYINKHKKR